MKSVTIGTISMSMYSRLTFSPGYTGQALPLYFHCFCLAFPLNFTFSDVLKSEKLIRSLESLSCGIKCCALCDAHHYCY